MFESQTAVATLRAPYQSAFGYYPDPRTNRCFQIKFEVLAGDEALAAFTDIELENQDFRQLFPATASEFSYKGLDIIGDLALLHETRLDKNSFVSIEMEVPGFWHKLRCVGSVSWVREDHELGYFKAGVSFLNVKKQNLEFVKRAMDKLSEP